MTPEAQSAPLFPGTAAPNLLKSAEVMAYLGYSNRSSFWQFIKSEGVPYIRMNSRRIMFSRPALNAWLERRAIGPISYRL